MFENMKWHSKLPSENLEVCESNLELFFETMFERQMIWKRRFIDNIPAPWTDNEILGGSKFTNVYRDLDRSSQWQIKNILLDENLSLGNLIWKLMVYRYFNNSNTFEVGSKIWRNGIPDYAEYNKKEFEDFILGIRKSGQNPYTNAYLINSMATPGKSRDYCYLKVVIPTLHKTMPQLIKTVLTAESPEEIITFLKTMPAVADFIAHEFYQDFTYIKKYTDRPVFMKFDQNDFTNVGPGASVGLRLIFPNLKVEEQKKGIYDLKEMSEGYFKRRYSETGVNFPYLEWNKGEKCYEISDIHNITLHQIEMWLCEFQKYWKMMIGEGKQRSKFVPITKQL